MPGVGRGAPEKSPELRAVSYSLNPEPAPDGSPTSDGASRYRSHMYLNNRERASLSTARVSTPQ